MPEADSSELVKVESQDGCAILRLCRPPVNAINLELARALVHALIDLDDDRDVDAVIITGDGDAFSAGLDLKAIPRYNNAQRQEMVVQLGEVIELLYGFRGPTVAAVNGHAVAAGTLLTLCCDYRIGPEDACRFGLTGVRVGVPYPTAVMALIVGELGPADRRHMLLQGHTIDPAEAMERNIIDELAPKDQVLTRAIAVAKELAAGGGETYRVTKQQVREPTLTKIREANATARETPGHGWLSGEAARAFAEDKHPRHLR